MEYIRWLFVLYKYSEVGLRRFAVSPEFVKIVLALHGNFVCITYQKACLKQECCGRD